MPIANKYCQNFGVGDIVVIREWEDMESEFGCDCDGDISICGTYFVTSMKRYCGLNCKVVGIDDYGYYIIEPVDTKLKGYIDSDWFFGDEMLYAKDDENSVVCNELSEFLLSIMK